MTNHATPPVPSDQKAEFALTVAKVAASFLPFGGGAAAEILGAVIAPHIERRKTAWVEAVADGLDDLRTRVAELTPERLAQDDAFATAFLHASQIAMRAHQREKLAALRNAVLNVAIGAAPDESLQSMFLDAVDTLTPWHLRLLDCVADPIGWAKRHDYWVEPSAKPDAGLIFDAFYRDQVPAVGFAQQLLQDLYNRGLATNNVNPHERQSFLAPSDAQYLPAVTDMGRQFLAFITSPDTTALPGTPGSGAAKTCSGEDH